MKSAQFRNLRMVEWIVGLNLVVSHLFLVLNGVPIRWVFPFYATWELLKSFTGVLLVGLGLRLLGAVVLGRGRRFLESIANRLWLIQTVRILLVASVGTYVYVSLKAYMPLATTRVADELLWELDRVLLFGMSPNVLFLDLFASPTLLFAVDWSYERIFLNCLRGVLIFGLSSPSLRVRNALVGSKVMMWMAGAWLYYSLPSMGPAYRYVEVWEGVRELFPRTRLMQAILLENYQRILGLSTGRINLFFGIGAFPSLHVAFHAFLALWLRLYSKILGILGIAALIVIFLGSVITGWHYLVDSIAGLLIGGIFYLVITRYFRMHRYTYHWRREVMRPSIAAVKKRLGVGRRSETGTGH